MGKACAVNLTFTTTKEERGRKVKVAAIGTLPNQRTWSRVYRKEHENGLDDRMLRAFEKLARTQAYEAFEKACAAVATTGGAP